MTTDTVMNLTQASDLDYMVPEIWAARVYQEARAQMLWERYTGPEGSAMPVIRKVELLTNPGDTINIQQVRNLTKAGVTSTTRLKGQEEKLVDRQVVLTPDWFRHAVAATVRTDKRITEEFRGMAQNLLAYWMAKKMDDSLWAAARATGSVGFEATTINAIYGGDATTVDTLDASDTFSVAVIRKAATKLIALDATKIRTPDMPAGEGYFICFIHPYQAYSLKGDSEWVNRYQYAGPKYPDNPLFTGALGEVDGVILLESTQASTTWNANSPSIRTAQALMLAAECLARGQEESIVWSEQIDDYEFEHGIGIRAAWEDLVLSQEALIHIYTAAVDPSA